MVGSMKTKEKREREKNIYNTHTHTESIKDGYQRNRGGRGRTTD